MCLVLAAMELDTGRDWIGLDVGADMDFDTQVVGLGIGMGYTLFLVWDALAVWDGILDGI